MVIETSMRLLLLQAWRERWTDVEWGVQLKKLLPQGTSGDTYDLSELILSQALVGFSPNSLMLTYLQNAVNSNIVSLAATLRVVVRHDDMNRPHSVKALMEMTKNFLQTAVQYGNSEDPLSLAKCLLATLKWALSCAHKSLLQLADNRPNPEYGSILDLMCEILQVLLESSASRALVAIAASDDADLYREINQTEANVRGTLAQLNGSIVTQSQRQNVDVSLKLLGKINEMGQESCGVLATNFLHNPTVNVFIHQEAILNPVGAIEPIVDVLILIEKMQCLTRPRLLCDVIRAGFLGIIDVIGGPHELKWVAFTSLKMPQIFVKLQAHAPNVCENMMRACEMLLHYSSLVEALESKYTSCSCVQLLMDQLAKNNLLTEQQVEQLMASPTMVRFKMKPSEPASQSTPTLILRAELTVFSILKTLDADYTKNQEALLGVLCHMMSGKSFELILAAAAANGKLRNFALKMIRFNEFAKASASEGSRASVTRSQLFDISFLMLCHIAQFYGLEIMENREASSESFFYHWACNYLPLNGEYKSNELWKQPEQGKVDALIAQINVGGELKTSLVRWFEVCNAVPCATRDVLLAWEAGTVQRETVEAILTNLKSRLGCLAVVACAWLCSYVNIIPENSREKPRQMIDIILTSAGQQSDPPSQNYSERAHLMTSICSTMTREVGLDTGGVDQVLSGKTPALELLTKTLRQVYKDGCVYLSSVYTFDKLLNACGVSWFCDAVVTEMLNHTYPEDLSQSVALTLGIFLLNIEQLSLCFLNKTLPRFLQGVDYKLQILFDPKGRALAQFAVMLISMAAQLRPYYQKFPAILKRGAALQMTDISFEEQPKLEEERPAKQRKEEVLTLQSEFNFDLQESMDDSEHYDTKDRLNQTMVRLYSLLTAIIDEQVLSPRNSFIVHFVRESVRCGPHSRYILQFMSSSTVQHLQKSMPGVLTMESLLSISDISTTRGRCIAANAVCQSSRQSKWKIS